MLSPVCLRLVHLENLWVATDSPEGRNLLPDSQQEVSPHVLGNGPWQRSHRALACGWALGVSSLVDEPWVSARMWMRLIELASVLLQLFLDTVQDLQSLLLKSPPLRG